MFGIKWNRILCKIAVLDNGIRNDIYKIHNFLNEEKVPIYDCPNFCQKVAHDSIAVFLYFILD